jgi:dTDP-glucose 4,6-dehydratase
LEGKNLPIYGDGANIRDWLHVEDHCSAIWEVLNRGRVGETYCIVETPKKQIGSGGYDLCHVLDEFKPEHAPHQNLKTFVKDRPRT